MDKMRIERFSWVLTDLIVDLGTASKLYCECINEEKFDPFNNKYHLGKVRICHMSAIVALSKLCEALTGYANELKSCCSQELVQKTWKWKAAIEGKKIYEFRSKYAAHVFDKETNEPLDLIAGYERLTNIVGKTQSEVQEFYDWISNVKTPADDLLSHLVLVNGKLADSLGGKVPPRK